MSTYKSFILDQYSESIGIGASDEAFREILSVLNSIKGRFDFPDLRFFEFKKNSDSFIFKAQTEYNGVFDRKSYFVFWFLLNYDVNVFFLNDGVRGASNFIPAGIDIILDDYKFSSPKIEFRVPFVKRNSSRFFYKKNSGVKEINGEEINQIYKEMSRFFNFKFWENIKSYGGDLFREPEIFYLPEMYKTKEAIKKRETTKDFLHNTKEVFMNSFGNISVLVIFVVILGFSFYLFYRSK